MCILTNIYYYIELFKKYIFIVLKSQFFEIQRGIQKVEKYPGLNPDLMSQGYKHV